MAPKYCVAKNYYYTLDGEANILVKDKGRPTHTKYTSKGVKVVW